MIYVQELVKHSVSLEFNCVNREANEAAHLLCAKIASSSLGVCEWQHHVLDFLLGHDG
jgi:hypothetical protein